MSNQLEPPAGPDLAASEPLTSVQRYVVLASAFLGWMFAGLEMANFPLATGAIVRDLLEGQYSRQAIDVQAGTWFGRYISAFLLGAATGGLLFGWLGDRIGRSKAMGLSILCYSLLTGLGYFAGSLDELLVLRFLACLGIGGMWPNGVALASEAWPDSSRPMLAGLIGTSANVGFVLMGLAAQLREVTADDWRWVMLLGGSPAVLALLVLAFVPESPRWLAASQGRRLPAGRGRPALHSGTIVTVFRSPYLPLTILGICLGTIPLLGGWGTNNWLIKWADQVGEEIGRPRLKATTVWVGSTGAAIGSLLGGWVANSCGRRATYFAISLGSLLVSGWIFWLLSPAQGLLFLAALFLLRLVSTSYFGWLPLYLPELFPTEVRSTGTGVTFNFGRILSAAGVLGTGALLGYFGGDYAATGRVTHLIYAAGMLVILFAPDTSGRRMDD